MNKDGLQYKFVISIEDEEREDLEIFGCRRLEKNERERERERGRGGIKNLESVDRERWRRNIELKF